MDWEEGELPARELSRAAQGDSVTEHNKAISMPFKQVRVVLVRRLPTGQGKISRVGLWVVSAPNHTCEEFNQNKENCF